MRISFITLDSKSCLKMFLDVISKEVSTAVTLEPTWSAYKALLEYHGINLETIKTKYINWWTPSKNEKIHGDRPERSLIYSKSVKISQDGLKPSLLKLVR